MGGGGRDVSAERMHFVNAFSVVCLRFGVSNIDKAENTPLVVQD